MDVSTICVPLLCVVVDVFCRLLFIGGCILIEFDRYILCFCVRCVHLCVVFFIVYLVFSAFLIYQTNNEKHQTQTKTMVTKTKYIAVTIN